MPQYTTRFGSLLDYQKGGVEAIDDEPEHYAFSNMFEVAANAKAWEKVAVGKNQEYVLEVIRAEGTVTVELVKLDHPDLPADKRGSVRIEGVPTGRAMGRIVAGRGHMALLPAGAAYRFRADEPGVILLQTIEGDDTIYRWAEIIQTG
jgi:hypothetical protein